MANTAYFDPAVGGTGLTVTDDGNPTTGLDNDGHRERLVPAFSNVVQVAKFVVDTAQDVNDDATTASTAAITAATSVPFKCPTSALLAYDMLHVVIQYSIHSARTSVAVSRRW